MANNYVDNKRFLEELIKYREECAKAKKERRNSLPRPSNYIGECLLLISQNLSTKSNFSNYPFRDEMVSDGIENCLTYLKNFDPAKSKNPFAYFTQIIYYAFIRRIQKEKKILYTKGKYTERAFLENRNYASIDGTSSNEFGNVTDIENPMDTEYMHALIGYKDDQDAAKKVIDAAKKEEAKKPAVLAKKKSTKK